MHLAGPACDALSGGGRIGGPVAQGSLRDRDVHAGQQNVPLAALVPA